MTDTTLPALTPAQFRNPPILLAGTVDYDMYRAFRSQLMPRRTAGSCRSNCRRSAAIPRWRA